MTQQLLFSSVSAGSAALMLLLLMVASRLLGPDAYGGFQVATTLATVAEVFMDFGLHQITIRAIAAAPSQAGRMLQTSLKLKIIPGVAMVAVLGAVAFYLSPEFDVRVACLLMLASAVMRSYLLTARGVLQGLERFGHDAIVTTADRALLFAVCGTALWLGAGLIEVSVLFLAVRIATATGAIRLAGRGLDDRIVDSSLWRSLPLEAIPVGMFLLVLNVYNRIDTLMLTRMSGTAAVGYYGAAYPVYEGLTYGAAILAAVLAPRLSRLWVHDRGRHARLARRSSAVSAVLAVVVAAMAWPWARQAPAVVFGDAYGPAGPTFQVLLVGLPAIYAIWVLHAVAISASRTRILTLVTAIGIALNVLLNLLLIPSSSYFGAAVATVFSEAVVLGLLAFGLRRELARPKLITASDRPEIPPPPVQ